jgi:HK97 family phage portal protein
MISYLLPQRAATVQTLGHPAAGVIGWVDASSNRSGVTVTESTALTLASVWCAVRVISETIATLPCMLYRRTSGDTRERATDDDRYWLLTEQPHPHMSAVTFFEAMTARMVLHGNCYAEIVWAGGMPRQLELRNPESVYLEIVEDDLVYRVANPDSVVLPEKMLHIAGLGGDGLTGWSVIRYAQESIGSALAADQYAAGQWGNGGTPNGVLKHPMRLDKSAREHLRREWEEIHRGSNNAGRVAIMHGGMEFQPISMPNKDAQFLESRDFSVREVARWFRLPPHMLADLSNSSVRANIEQQALEFIVYSLKPWLTRWQQALNRKLLVGSEQREMYFEFLLESLLQGDSAAQANAWSVGRQWGWYSVNDIRKMLNMTPVSGGDVYLQPVNMVPADSEMASGERAEPEPILAPPPGEDSDDEGEEEIDEQAAKALGENWRETMAAIVATGRDQLQQVVASGASSFADVATHCDEAASSHLESLRELREEIHRDILRPILERARGCDVGLVYSAHALLHEHVRVAQKRERSEVSRAAKTVARGAPLNEWLDDYYGRFAADLAERIKPACDAYRAIRPHCSESLASDVADRYCAAHVAEISAASRGNRAGCAQRVQAVLDSWEPAIQEISMGD